MTLAIQQPFIFPYIGYWQLLKVSDTFVIFDDVNYVQKGYINRNSILIGGKSHRFNLELIGASQNKLINEIELVKNNTKFLKTIFLAYKKAPYFNTVYPILEDILSWPETNLSKFLGYSMEKISDYLQIKNNIIYSSNIEKDSTLKRQDKVIDISKRLEASDYVNFIGGQKLYSKEEFAANGIKLMFLKTKIIEYKQFNNEFIPNLSIIDILMFNSIEEVNKMLKEYELI